MPQELVLLRRICPDSIEMSDIEYRFIDDDIEALAAQLLGPGPSSTSTASSASW